MSNLYYSVIISVLILKALWNLHGSCAPMEADSFLTAAVHCLGLSGLLPSSSHPGHPALLWLNIWSSRPAICLLRLSPPFFFFFLPRRRRRRRQREEEETKEEAEGAGIRCATSGWEPHRRPGRMSQRADSAIAASPRSDPPLTAEPVPHLAAVAGLFIPPSAGAAPA